METLGRTVTLENNIKMIKPGDRVLALDYQLWTTENELQEKDYIKSATVIDVRPCDNVPKGEPYSVLVDIYFDHRGIARSYFLDNLIKKG